MSRITRREWYARVNAAWPTPLPPLTGPEALRAFRRLYRYAFHRLPRFRSEASFRAWLLRITHNAALNALEHRRAEPLAGIQRWLNHYRHFWEGTLDSLVAYVEHSKHE